MSFIVSIIAVHGLASNPKTTWESRKHSEDTCIHDRQIKRPPDAPITKPMWLRDFLPEEGLDARIMAFNHNTAWEANALSKSLQDYGDDLLRVLCRARQSAEVRYNSLCTLFRLYQEVLILLRRRAGPSSSSVTVLEALSSSK